MIDDCPDGTTERIAAEGEIVRTCPIINRKGLHARATAKFVQCVERFDAEIQVSRCGETVGGFRILGILPLGAGLGSTVTISATGQESQAAIDALAELIANRFGEDE